MKRALILVGIVMAFVGVAAAQAGRISTRQWKLVELNGTEVDASSRAYLELESGQTRFTGHTGCNRMFGSIQIQGQRVDFSGIGTTRMACVETGAGRIEATLLKTLENVDRWEQKDNSLELYAQRRLVMRFTAPIKRAPVDPATAVGLEDKKWMLEAIDGVAVPKIARTAFVVFDKEKQSAGGDSSCNLFGGSYTVAGDKLKITEVVSTMRACIEDDRMKIEREFLDALQKSNRHEIVGEKLMLYQNKRLLLTLEGEDKR